MLFASLCVGLAYAARTSRKKVEADIPKHLWDAFEEWATGRTKLTNRQILTGMFRLFLSVPEELRLLAIYGKDADLKARGDAMQTMLWQHAPAPPAARAAYEMQRVSQQVLEHGYSSLGPEDKALARLIVMMCGTGAHPKTVEEAEQLLSATEPAAQRPPSPAEEIASAAVTKHVQSQGSPPGRRRKGVGG